MAARFAYFYFMKNEADRIRVVATQHHEYWTHRGLDEYLGGPFADRSGGLITFEARDAGHARQLVENDPFVLDDLLESRWLKEWAVG